jgi:pimeloyl-ACP methyl ester carboxylesterase
MNQVTSKDGTSIAFDQLGQGTPVILVSGGSVDRGSNASLATLLAKQFSVFNFDRRGRGPSGDTLPYAVEREVEDIAAVAKAAGGSAYLYGSSSGAALALEAARQLSSITKLALWEPPFILDPALRPPADTAKTFHDLVAAGQRGAAAEHFMAKVVGMPADFVTFAKSQPWWAAQEALAHTLEYDATIMGDYSMPKARVAEVKIPTIVINGSKSMPFFQATGDAMVKLLAHGQRSTLEGQEHNVSAEVLAPVLLEFFAAA